MISIFFFINEVYCALCACVFFCLVFTLPLYAQHSLTVHDHDNKFCSVIADYSLNIHSCFLTVYVHSPFNKKIECFRDCLNSLQVYIIFWHFKEKVVWLLQLKQNNLWGLAIRIFLHEIIKQETQMPKTLYLI